MNQRIIPWGTVIAGAIALGTAALVGLTEIAGVSVPIGSAGPGAVIVVGLLILVTGLVVVLRSNRAGHAGDRQAATTSTPPQSAAEAAGPSGATTAAPSEAPAAAEDASSGPLDVTDVGARQSSH